MSRILRGTLLACYLGFVLLSAGCGEDNEKTANLKGEAPTDNKTEKERLDMMKGMGGGAAVKGTGYPGTKKK
jgi:hypothetical protein